MKNKITVIGGDTRQVYLANIMSENYEVYMLGNEHDKLSSNVHSASSLEEAIKDSHFIIGPIPFSRDNMHIFTPNSEEKILYMDLFNLMTPDKYIFAGPYKKDVIRYAKDNNINLFDIVDADEFAILNSIPTAEGVISMMINNIGITLANNRCLVLGYGRCGMAISDLALKLNMDVYVASTNDEELMMATINRCKTAKLQDKQLKKVDYLNPKALDKEEEVLHLEMFNYVINTIPVTLVDIHLRKKLEDYIFIDIANVYEDNENKFINARGVPGKYSPKTAAKIIQGVIEKEISTHSKKNIERSRRDERIRR